MSPDVDTPEDFGPPSLSAREPTGPLPPWPADAPSDPDAPFDEGP